MINEAYRFTTVMIIDDNNIDLYINAQVIKRSNFAQKILQYSSAAIALEYLRVNGNDLRLLPQVIFVDIYMPGMSGFEFAEAFSLLPSNIKGHSRIYVISSSIDKQDLKYIATNPDIIALHEKPLSKAYLETILP